MIARSSQFSIVAHTGISKVGWTRLINWEKTNPSSLPNAQITRDELWSNAFRMKNPSTMPAHNMTAAAVPERNPCSLILRGTYLYGPRINSLDTKVKQRYCVVTTYPELATIASKSVMLYSKAIAKGKAVENPTTTTPTQANGTTLRGFFASSDKCNEASRPPYINAGVRRPVIRQMPSGQPVWLMKVVQTNS